MLNVEWAARIQHSTSNIQHLFFMDILFTPWRYPYLTSSKPTEPQPCIFCVAAASSDERGTLTLLRSDLAVVMLNRYPYANGHIMVAPVAHEARLFESTNDSLQSLIRLTADAQRILSDVYRPDGFNVGMNFGQSAGAGIADHYHMHVVPRWSGDSNFMTVTARTRLVPEELDVTFDKLRPRFDSLHA
jgi:ATP adenylyltransferase